MSSKKVFILSLIWRNGKLNTKHQSILLTLKKMRMEQVLRAYACDHALTTKVHQCITNEQMRHAEGKVVQRPEFM